MLATPLLREGVPIGLIVMRRAEVQPFTEKQIELAKTFADQAVIAIENVRLFNETKEALEQQTATAEILRVISSSPTDVQPVFEAIARSAARLCEAVNGSVVRFDGRVIHMAAQHGNTPEAVEANRRVFPRSPDRGSVTGRAILTRAVVHVDVAEDPEYEHSAIVQAGFRTALAVPMLRDGDPIGAIVVTREEGRIFSETQIALLKIFADQAVIAIENVRLFTELGARNQELTGALARQTATSEILQVIGRSPTDAQPVFEAIVKSASRLLGGAWTVLTHVREGALHLAAHELSGMPDDAVREGLRSWPRALDDESPVVVAVRSGQMRSVADAQNDPQSTAAARATAVAMGHRCFALMPMLKDGQGIGGIHVARPAVGPFTDVELALLRTFADQAVIAIENVRLFQELEARNAELTESLEQQTATAEILRVIASSPTELQPVMEAVAEHAARVCGAADSSIYRLEGEHLRLVARRGTLRRTTTAIGATIPVSSRAVTGRVVGDRRTIHVEDILAAETEFPATVSRARQPGAEFRTLLATPLLREGMPLGVIIISRGPEVQPFSAKQIVLLETFANQAVIAIENVRLFTELQEKNRAVTEAHAQVTETLEQQTATSEILRVIASSPTDTQPVFDAIVRSAARLCDGMFCSAFRFDGERLHRVASYNFSSEAAETLDAMGPLSLTRGNLGAKAILERVVVHVPDIEKDREAVETRERARLIGFRAILAAPMLREGRAIGTIHVGRRDPGPFTRDRSPSSRPSPPRQ